MTEKDVILMTKSDMTVKILLSELNKSQLGFQNGLNDTSQPAQDRKITTTKSTEWKNGTTNSSHLANNNNNNSNNNNDDEEEDGY